MPKMKTKKSVTQKFKVTAKGKLKRNRPGRRHILEKKSRDTKRKLCRSAYVDESFEKTYKRLMCV